MTTIALAIAVIILAIVQLLFHVKLQKVWNDTATTYAMLKKVELSLAKTLAELVKYDKSPSVSSVSEMRSPSTRIIRNLDQRTLKAELADEAPKKA